MKVLHSALKGEIIVLDRALDSSDALVGSAAPSEEAYLNLQNGEAWTEIEAESAEALQNDLKTKENQARVFTLFLPLFDSSLTQGCRTAIAGEIEDTLASDSQAILLSSQRFHAAVFPQPSRLDEALLIAGNAKCARLSAFLRTLSRRQPLIADAVAAWSQMPSSVLPDRLDSEAARSLLIQAGTFLRLVESNAIGRFSQDFLRSELRNPQLLRIPNIENWLYKFLLPFHWKEKEEHLEPHELQAYTEYLEGWKKTIMELVKARPEGARQAAMVLKNEQLTKGHARFAAMTLCDLAKQCKAQGRVKSQLAMAELAVRANPHDPQCHCQYADAQKGNNLLQIALITYTATIAEFPEDVVARNGKAEVLRELNRLAEALAYYEETIARFSEAVVARCGKAEVLRELNRLPEALACYEETIAKFSEAVVARCGKAEVLRELNRLPEALACYEETIVEFPSGVVARNGKAEVLRDLNRLPEALACYEATMVEFPGDVVARCGKAEVLRDLNRLPEALGCYEATMVEFPGDVFARNGKAEVLRDLNRLPEALVCYEATTVEFPRDVVARNGKAEVLRDLNRLPEALVCYEETIVEFPGGVFARNGKAEVLRDLNRLPEALACYEETIVEFPGDVFARCGKAEALRDLNRLPEALACYESTIVEFPGNVVARNGKAGVLAKLRRFDEALGILPEYPTLANDWVGYHMRGMILLKMGHVDSATTIFEQGCNSSLPKKQLDFFQTTLALCYIKNQETGKALGILPGASNGRLRILVPLLTAHALGENEDILGCERNASGIISYGRESYLEPAREIIARYVVGAPRHSKDWLFEHEMELALAA